MSVRTLCTRSVTIQKVTLTDDAYGTATEDRANRYTSVPMRIQPISGAEMMLYSRQATEVTHKAFVPMDLQDFSGITETDEVVDGSTTYTIVLVRNIDVLDHHLEIELRRLSPAV